MAVSKNQVITELEKLNTIYEKVSITYNDQNDIKEIKEVTIEKSTYDEILARVNVIRKLIII